MKHKSETDWERVEALTDEDIRKAIAEDPDAAPEWTGGDFARARPASEVLPYIVAAYRRRRRAGVGSRVLTRYLKSTFPPNNEKLYDEWNAFCNLDTG